MNFITHFLAEKRRWRQYKAATTQLSESYRTAIRGIERYLLNTGPGDGVSVMNMLEDLLGLFEQAAADDMSIQDLIGNPVEFADDFKSIYGVGAGMAKEHQRLTSAITRSMSQQSART
jgi:DNA-binding ferritin-like protein (Dps family)